MENYYELIISINPDIEEIVSDLFFTNFKCEGVILAEESYKDLKMISTTKGNLKVFLKEYPKNLKEILYTERELLKSRGFTDDELGSWNIELDEKENQDWSQKWKEKWDITHVTDKISVVPSWLSYTPKENEIIIILDPGCAFGTGTHQTTQLCMKALEKYMPKGASVADIGTGSGILAICALKLGASSVYGCDNDPSVIDVCIENAKKNGIKYLIPQENSDNKNAPVENFICFELNTADKLIKKYDFICANILHNVLAEIMGDLKNIMKPDSKMVLSGILDEKKDIVINAVKKENLHILDILQQDQWVAIIVKN